MLAQTDGPKALLARAGANAAQLQAALEDALKRLPQVQGGEPVQPGRELSALLQAAEKEANKRGDQFIASELFLLAAADSKTDVGSDRSRSSAPRARRSRRRSMRCAAARRSTAPRPKASARR